MATYTSNINLKKPAGGDKIRIADINGNMDNIDAAVGAGFGQGTAPSINQAINSLADGLAIIANGNVHAAISAGQFVYVRNHGSLAEGLYTADSNISTNGTLSSNNLTADTSGGLNALKSNIATLADEATMARGAVSDTNSALTPGAYTVTSGTVNAATSNGILFTIDASGGRRMQLQFMQNHFYCRFYTGTLWGDWREITTTAIS